MDENLGMVTLESERSLFLQVPGEFATMRRDFSEQTAHEIDCAVRGLIASAFEKAVTLLETHSVALEEGAKNLLEKETLLGEELPELQPQ
jgi:cell division protease FtsH